MKYLQIFMPNVNIERNYLLLLKYVSKYKNHAIKYNLQDIKSDLFKIVHVQVVIESNWQKVLPEKVTARNMTFTSWSYY